jgi:hypothetical protein
MARTKQKRGDYVIDWRNYGVTHTPTGVHVFYAAADAFWGLVSAPETLITKHPKGKKAGEKLLREILDRLQSGFCRCLRREGPEQEALNEERETGRNLFPHHLARSSASPPVP